MKKLYFVRHGQSEYNRDGLLAGTTETALTHQGKEQAHASGENAKSLDIDYIISSPISRAYDTAKIIAEEIGYPIEKIEVNELLRERHFGEAEGSVWSIRSLEGTVGLEDAAKVIARATAMLKYVETLPYDTILLVSHGAMLRAYRSVVDPEHNSFGNEIGATKNAQMEQLV